MKDLKWLLLVVAAFLLLSSLAHGILGWKAMRAELERANVPPDLLGDMAVGWYLGSVAMVVFAVIVLLSWQEARGQRFAGRAATATIALAYFGFGMLAFLFRSFHLHFLIVFVLPGALLGVAVLKSRWASHK
ncbi:MAG: hypothetical protein L0387_07440 [Acidobacteria bacterium]|nr:hypothetical protein [Acidobacteriota bacterium]